MRPARVSIVIVLGLVALTLIPRLIGLDLFATIDEPYWLTAGSDFYYALGQRDFALTVYDYHPAVTTMWIVAGAMLLYFPQYRGMGQGYFDVYKDSLDQFLISHDRTPLGLLTAARALQVVVVVVLLLLVFWLLRRIFDERVAVLGVLLVSFDPFFLGHSRLLTHEGMMALLSLISILAAAVHLFFDRNRRHLVLSGIAMGLAQLTKSSSAVVVAVVGLLFVFAAVRRKEGGRRPLTAMLGDLAIWVSGLVLVYVLLWPGLWVAPGRMLYEVFGNAFSYVVGGARLSAILPQTQVVFQPRFTDILLYTQSMLWRTTPIVWLGVILAVIAFFWLQWQPRIVVVSLLSEASLFVILFGIASGRNSAHYVLASYVALDILAAIGLAHFAALLSRALRATAGRVIGPALLGAAVLFQGGSALLFYPYYYNYYSPIMEGLDPGRQNPNWGYGEGLDLAASYLAQKPGAADSAAVAFYGRGPFSYFYPGRTEPLKTVYAEAENVPQLQEILASSDYLVIYYALQRGRNSPPNVMRALADAIPEQTIWLNGIEYVRIYAVDELPNGFFPSLWP